jgi:hypothetical protein
LITALSLQSSLATLRRCSFVQTAAQGAGEFARRDGDPLIWVAQLDNGVAMGGQPLASKVTAHECFFGGGLGAFYLDGPAKLDLTDCTVLPYRSTILIKSFGLSQKLAAELRLTNVSLFGSGSPIFELVFARAAIHSQSVVYSHEAPSQGVLARIEADSRLDWRGRNNLFHGLRQFLTSRTGSETVPPAENMSDWIALGREVDERDSVGTDESPWLMTLAEAANRDFNDPRVADAFRLARDSGKPTWPLAGARIVLPWGPLYPVKSPDSLSWKRSPFAVARSEPASVNSIEPDRGQFPPDATTERSSKPDAAAVPARPGEPLAGSRSKLDITKIMNTGPAGDSSVGAAQTVNPENRSATESAATPAAPKGTLIVDPKQNGAFHSLAEACARAEDGSVIEIRHTGKLQEGIIELGDRHLTIRASAGFRPTIEFAISQLDLRGREPRLFDVRHGSLTLRELDFRMTVDPAVGAETWSLITTRSADVNLEGCTGTVAAPLGSSSHVLRLLASEMDDPMAAPAAAVAPTRPQLQIHNSMIVGVGGLVRLQPAVRLRVELGNCAIETMDNLLAVTGGMDRSVFGAVNELEIRHSTIRLRRSLVSYEATETRAWLPRLEVNAADNILMGDENSPWIRFRSPKPADELRGLFRWKGMNNSYDGVESFWEIESMIGGESETIGWDHWLKSPARDEIKAERRRLAFSAQPDASQPWLRTREHFKLDPSQPMSEMASDGSSRGADLSLIPAPPQERESESRIEDRR